MSDKNYNFTNLNILNNRDSEIFFELLFSQALQNCMGEIEIRAFKKNGFPKQNFFSSIPEAIRESSELVESDYDVYFGVNPRIGKKGGENNIQYVVAFHADIDYGDDGHKKKSKHQNKDDAFAAIQNLNLQPTAIVHSGGGFHCYWVLEHPINVLEVGIDRLKNINKALLLELGGDQGTHDLPRIFRVPGTKNFKNPDDPRLVSLESIGDMKYSLEDFDFLENTIVQNHETKNNKSTEPNNHSELIMNNIFIWLSS